MSSPRLGALLLILSFTAFLNSESFAQTPPPSASPPGSPPASPPLSAPSPEWLVKRILTKQEIAWNVGDSASWGSAFAEDADFINWLGQAFHGREAITQLHATIFGGQFKGTHTTLTMHQFRQITPDVVLVELLHEVTGFRSLPAGIAPTEAGVLKARMKYVLVKHEELWQIVAAQSTAIIPP